LYHVPSSLGRDLGTRVPSRLAVAPDVKSARADGVFVRPADRVFARSVILVFLIGRDNILTENLRSYAKIPIV